MRKTIKQLEKALLTTFKSKQDFEKMGAIRCEIYDLIRKYN